jgi:hypothetical protein
MRRYRPNTRALQSSQSAAASAYRVRVLKPAPIAASDHVSEPRTK